MRSGIFNNSVKDCSEIGGPFVEFDEVTASASARIARRSGVVLRLFPRKATLSLSVVSDVKIDILGAVLPTGRKQE